MKIGFIDVKRLSERICQARKLEYHSYSCVWLRFSFSPLILLIQSESLSSNLARGFGQSIDKNLEQTDGTGFRFSHSNDLNSEFCALYGKAGLYKKLMKGRLDLATK